MNLTDLSSSEFCEFIEYHCIRIQINFKKLKEKGKFSLMSILETRVSEIEIGEISGMFMMTLSDLDIIFVLM